MKKVILCSLVIVAFLSSCGSTWTVSGNSVDVNVISRDTVMRMPSGTSVLDVDTGNGISRVYVLPKK